MFLRRKTTIKFLENVLIECFFNNVSVYPEWGTNSFSPQKTSIWPE
uniref:Uncharacterized protein n=1 Tax=Meloidogyne enterolobii TaxID=390850 RepID=A0A6V7UKH3_MELEN|nr:unnamed protein product [Meloidogyne enterolobii]